MTEPASIPLNKLVVWSGNVRKTAGADTALAELAASIAAHGLLQSLVVRKDRKGKFAVVAGGRRLQALKILSADGKIPADYAVHCQLVSEHADATEISLAENAVREQMHPADEFEAFQALAEKGMPAVDIAARFGVTERVVLQRLKLARVSPVLIKAYRNGKTSLDCLMAFAVIDDHGAQERLWKAAPAWLKTSARQIRDALTAKSVTAGDRRVKFVTLKAYEKAGGGVRRDLFSDEADGIFIEDVALLETLVVEKLQKTAKVVSREGWKWVEIRPEFDTSDWSQCERVFEESVPLSEADAAEFERLATEHDALVERSEGDDFTEDQRARLEVVSNRLDELKERETVWTDEAMAIAGAVVCVGYDGKPDIRRGFVNPEDQPQKPATAKSPVAGTNDDGTEAGEGSALPAALVESLTLHRTAAISAALASRPDIALAVLVHTLASQVLLDGASGNTCLEVFARVKSLRNVEGAPASNVMQKAQEQWGDRIPGAPDQLWQWCLEQEQDVLLDLLAFCLANTVNAVRAKADRPGDPRLTHASGLAAALDLDMAAWFTPSAGNYFGRISKAAIIDALTEAKGGIAPAWTKLKKTELAVLAERELAGTGWLPEILRRPAIDTDAALRDAA